MNRSNSQAFRRALLILGALFSLLSSGFASEPPSASAILQEMRAFRELGSALFVAAHPDDENTQLIAYFARERGARMGYLSLTRGEGGQDLIGPELGDALGVIRTQELLAARRVDGGQQFFSRARDFGYSKDYRQTLAKWDRQQVLADIVRTIRTFQPDVLITRFPAEASGTHGHHTASAVLAIEAFKLAGDAAAFPEQLSEHGLIPWQPKRLFWNSFRGFGNQNQDDAKPVGNVRLNIGGYLPLLGESLGEIAAHSRSMHRSQGMGSAASRGARADYLQPLDGQPAGQDIFDGIDTTWGRFPGGDAVQHLADEVISKYDPLTPSKSVAALLDLRKRLDALPPSPLVSEKRRQLDRIIQNCLGLYVETTIPQAEAVPGESLKLRHSAILRSDVSVDWVTVRYPGISQELAEDHIGLSNNQLTARDAKQILPANTPLTQPYWLRAEGTPGMYRVDDAALITQPENPPAFSVEYVFAVGGQTLIVPDEPISVTVDPVKGEIRRRLSVIPPVTLRLAREVEIFTPGAAHPVEVEISASRANADGALQLEAPVGWKILPESRPFHLAAVGDRARYAFTVTAPAQPATVSLVARANIGGASFSNARIDIRYDHIPPQLLQPPAQCKAVCLDLQIRGRQVGYLPGAGDHVAECLEAMGYAVTPLNGADLTPERLRAFDAVVLGVRAFNVRPDLAAGLPALAAYAEAGGNVIVQYNTPNGLQTPQLAPFDLKLSRDLPRNRVTDEKAPVTLLAPQHPAFTVPNRIGPADFDGWVQERGLNFPSEWDAAHFTALLACGDPGEAPLKSGLLVADCGRGHFVYTGLSFFRQLPAGAPGAYRLFANLISLGK